MDNKELKSYLIATLIAAGLCVLLSFPVNPPRHVQHKPAGIEKVGVLLDGENHVVADVYVDYDRGVVLYKTDTGWQSKPPKAWREVRDD